MVNNVYWEQEYGAGFLVTVAEIWDLDLLWEARPEPGWHARRMGHEGCACDTAQRLPWTQKRAGVALRGLRPIDSGQAPIFRVASVSNSIWRPSSRGRTAS